MSVDDFHHVQSAIQEVGYWKDLSEQSTSISTKSVAVEIYSILKPALPVFEYIQKHNDGASTCSTNMGDDVHAGISSTDTNIVIETGQDSYPSKGYNDKDVLLPVLHHKFHHQSFDFLERHFTDGNCIETALYNMFQVIDKHGNFIYSASVSIIICSIFK